MTTKTYTFKLDTEEDAEIIAAIERWRENEYTVKSMVATLVAKNEGLQIPQPKNDAFFIREIRRLDEMLKLMAMTMGKFEQKQTRFEEVQTELIDIVSEMNQPSTTNTVSEFLSDQMRNLLTTSEVEGVVTEHHNNHHVPLLGSQVVPT